MTSVKKMTAAVRKKQIVKKATELFSRHGFEGVTIGQLAESCGISEPALYKYFRSKKEIYSEVLRGIKAEIDITGLKNKISGLDDIEKILFETAQSLLQTYLNNPELTKLLLFCSLDNHNMTKDLFKAIRAPYTNLLKEELTRLREKKLIYPVNPDITARCFIGMVSECSLGFSLWKKCYDKSYKPLDSMKNTIPVFARGLKLK